LRAIYEPAVAQPKISGRAQRDLLDMLPIAIYETDSAGRITYYNAAAAELWGVKPELGKKRILRIVEAILARWYAAPAR
jgi:PAS domain-containing protein